MTQPSPLYRLIESKLPGTLAGLVEQRRPACSWQDIADEIDKATGVAVNRETLRLWFTDQPDRDRAGAA